MYLYAVNRTSETRGTAGAEGTLGSMTFSFMAHSLLSLKYCFLSLDSKQPLYSNLKPKMPAVQVV